MLPQKQPTTASVALCCPCRLIQLQTTNFQWQEYNVNPNLNTSISWLNFYLWTCLISYRILQVEKWLLQLQTIFFNLFQKQGPVLVHKIKTLNPRNAEVSYYCESGKVTNGVLHSRMCCAVPYFHQVANLNHGHKAHVPFVFAKEILWISRYFFFFH